MILMFAECKPMISKYSRKYNNKKKPFKTNIKLFSDKYSRAMKNNIFLSTYYTNKFNNKILLN